ncbi:MAG: hypothetical protein ACK51I_02130 [Chloroflexota bacterium]|jgi:hypothetical protein
MIGGEYQYATAARLGSGGRGPCAGKRLKAFTPLSSGTRRFFGGGYNVSMKYALAFGLIFVVIGTVYLLVSGDAGGAFMLVALGVAMSTMTAVLVHAMNSEA